MSAPSLLAKSLRKGRPPLTLLQHSDDAEQVARALFDAPSPWALAFPRFFKVDPATFLKHLRVAALFHDIGKANDGFLRALQMKGSQALRHEHLSALILFHPAVRRWLATDAALDLDVITAAVLSHHLKATPQDGRRPALMPSQGFKVELFLGHEQVHELLLRVSAIVEIGEPPSLRLTHLDFRALTGEWQLAVTEFWKAARSFGRLVGPGRSLNDAPRVRLALAVKAGVIAADSVASAMWREDKDISLWIDEVVRLPARIGGAEVRAAVLGPRSSSVAKKSQKQFSLHPFQDRAATLGARALLLAPCGAGKTIAAWRWAEEQATTRPVGRVVFLYPTRGTATEGFRDYVGWAPEGEGALVHGTAEYELAEMAANPPESLSDKSFHEESKARLFALGLWSKRYFSATVDQFLGFLENRYESLCLLPALADSVLILDEVHSYDNRMFRALKDLMAFFDVPVLCMTATLPPDRLRQLRELGVRVYPEEEELKDLPDLKAKADQGRYRKVVVENEEEALERVLLAVREGQRVLWVVNVVRRCQAIARRLRALGVEVIAYHSRFKLADRRRQHEEVVRRFQEHPSTPLVAVTTQVCEMSLDLDADMLVTEHAPVSALIQRLGRANRSASRDASFRADVVFYPPEKELPYAREEMEAAAHFIDEVPVESSQSQLALLLGKHSPAERDTAVAETGFVSGGYFAFPEDFRDGDDFGERCVLSCDVDEFLLRTKKRQETADLLLTVPGRAGVTWDEDARLPRFLKAARSEFYDSSLGFDIDGGNS